MIWSRYNGVVKDETMQLDSEQPSERAWRDLYLAALFEADLSKLAARIAVAEYAMSLRERELWYSGNGHESEKHALIGAMRALEALRNIHQCPRPAPSARSQTPEAASGVLGEVGKSAESTKPNISADRLITGGSFCK
jgi:hypothetical protein